jgi:membrane protein required for colicin V production
MNAVDIAILTVLALLLLKGLWLGLLQECCGLAGLVLGTVLAVRFHAALAATLPAWVGVPLWLAKAACFAVLFLATLVCFVLLGLLLSRILKLVFLGGFNRVLGGLFGLVQGVVVISLALYGLSVTDWFKETRQASRLSPPFVVLGEKILAGGRQLLS